MEKVVKLLPESVRSSLLQAEAVDEHSRWWEGWTGGGNLQLRAVLDEKDALTGIGDDTLLDIIGDVSGAALYLGEFMSVDSRVKMAVKATSDDGLEASIRSIRIIDAEGTPKHSAAMLRNKLSLVMFRALREEPDPVKWALREQFGCLAFLKTQAQSARRALRSGRMVDSQLWHLRGPLMNASRSICETISCWLDTILQSTAFERPPNANFFELGVNLLRDQTAAPTLRILDWHSSLQIHRIDVSRVTVLAERYGRGEPATAFTTDDMKLMRRVARLGLTAYETVPFLVHMGNRRINPRPNATDRWRNLAILANGMLSIANRDTTGQSAALSIGRRRAASRKYSMKRIVEMANGDKEAVKRHNRNGGNATYFYDNSFVEKNLKHRVIGRTKMVRNTSFYVRFNVVTIYNPLLVRRN
jgi:hypothetical protein